MKYNNSNVLNENFWRIPHLHEQAVTSKQLKQIMLDTRGWITANGRIWDITKKSLGGGVYLIKLKKREYDHTK